MNEKALNAKIESIESAAIMHVQNNSNKYKSYFGECTTNGTHCECTNNKCKYKFVINIKDLIKSGDLKKKQKTKRLSKKIHAVSIIQKIKQCAWTV